MLSYTSMDNSIHDHDYAILYTRTYTNLHTTSYTTSDIKHTVLGKVLTWWFIR